MENEFWVGVKYITNEGEIIEFDNYEISNYGNVRRRKKDGKVRELRSFQQLGGYMNVFPSKNNKTITCQVHRLVLSSFQTDQYFPGAQVDHINSIRDDNRLENLRWVTPKENYNTEHRKKCLSEAKKGSNNHKSQSCFYDNKEFSSIKEAYRYAIENELFSRCYMVFRKMIKKI